MPRSSQTSAEILAAKLRENLARRKARDRALASPTSVSPAPALPAPVSPALVPPTEGHMLAREDELAKGDAKDEALLQSPDVAPDHPLAR